LVRIQENERGTLGDEILKSKADSKSEKNLDSNLTNRTSQELIDLWRRGAQEAAEVLLARYEVRLIALVAARLSRKHEDRIAPEDIVQSAMGSFFRVTKADVKPSIKLESTLTAWNILATFARRKLARALERETALKRGGGWSRISLDDLAPGLSMEPTIPKADEILVEVRSVLDEDQIRLLDLLLENASQAEAAEKLGVDERTVRRRIRKIRETVVSQHAMRSEADSPAIELSTSNISLPNISYRTFVLGKLLGSGALGKVYLAQMQTDGMPIAVKFMHRKLWNNPTSRFSLLNEIDQASKINHPGIIKYLGWGQSPHGGPYLVSEYVAGRSLTSIGSCATKTAVQWLVQICQAMAASHEAGIVHGDLTPNNVLVNDSGRVVIIDFGLATQSQHQPTQEPSDVSFSDTIQAHGGTLGFAAPEQISNAFGTIGYRTDIYAIGGLAYYLLCGRCPHAGDSIVDTLSDSDLAITESPTTPAGARLLSVAKAALKKSIGSRPESAIELLQLLLD
jgi:DNA-directed RNA polymerase specialized sigma24 family protein/predicted Ser/Thr protein kinase